VKACGLTLGRAEPVVASIKAIDPSWRHEHSFQLAPGKILRARALWSFDKRRATQGDLEGLLKICVSLGLPLSQLDDSWQRLADTAFIGFGYQEDNGQSTYKLYLETRLSDDAIIRARHEGVPVLLYVGHKWKPGGVRSLSTTYEWRPGLSRDGIRRRLARVYDASRESSVINTLGSILDAAAGRTSPRNVAYLDVYDGRERHTSSLNVYNARMRIADITEVIKEASSHLRCPSAEITGLCHEISGCIVGHVAGGLDSMGRPFVTVYHQPPEENVRAR
jgi:hypothetical protein